MEDQPNEQAILHLDLEVGGDQDVADDPTRAASRGPGKISTKLALVLLAVTGAVMSVLPTMPSVSNDPALMYILYAANGGGFLLLLRGIILRERGVSADILIFCGATSASFGVVLASISNVLSGAIACAITAIALLILLAATVY